MQITLSNSHAPLRDPCTWPLYVTLVRDLTSWPLHVAFVQLSSICGVELIEHLFKILPISANSSECQRSVLSARDVSRYFFCSRWAFLSINLFYLLLGWAFYNSKSSTPNGSASPFRRGIGLGNLPLSLKSPWPGITTLRRRKADVIKVEGRATAGNLSHITFNSDKKRNHSNGCCKLKWLVQVGDPCLVAGENIPEVPQDCVPCTYHLMFFQKIKKRFGLSEIGILTLADGSGLTVSSTNAKTHKIDGPTLKPFNRVQLKDKLKKAYLFFEKTFVMID